MTELERTKEALAIAIRALNSAYDTARNQVIAVHLAEINAILNPAPIMESVEEIVGWVNVYQNPENGEVSTDMQLFKTENSAFAASYSNRVACHPVKVPVKREKKPPQEMSVTVDVHVGDCGDAYGVGESTLPFKDYPETYNTRGSLTYTWPKKPTT